MLFIPKKVFKTVWLSRIQAMNFAPLTTRCHSSITGLFTQLQITQGLHSPSSTAPTQLSALITHTPEYNLPITITQSHTHTHTLHKPWTFSHSLPSIVSQLPFQSVFLVSLVCFPVFRFRPCPWIILSALPSGLSLPIADPRLPKDYSSVLSMPYPFAPARPCLYWPWC